jgi:NADPH2:quinone reductase
LAADHGADVGIDYAKDDFKSSLRTATGGRGVNVFIDLVGGTIGEAGLRALSWGGRMVIVGWASGTPPAIPANQLWFRHTAALGFTLNHHITDYDGMKSALDDIFGWHEAGIVKPRVLTFPLAAAAEALEKLLAREVTGKLVLTVEQAS